MRVTNHRWLRKPKSKEESVDEKVFV
jgi:hypothetical protein